MARNELMAKTISRHTLRETLMSGGDTRNAKTARGITTGSRWEKYSPAEVQLINKSIEEYGKYANNIYVKEGLGDITAKDIRQQVEEHVSLTGKRPVVVVDYLQILSPHDPRMPEKWNTDKAVMELKRISRDYKIPVIAISSFNRENYENAVTMKAFKESGGIEYSADVVIGLQFKGAGGTSFNTQNARKKTPREIQLVILKNRHGEIGDPIEYEYYPMFNYFKEA
jgi:replicative DNA helicase